jgi:hypothetical protein
MLRDHAGRRVARGRQRGGDEGRGELLAAGGGRNVRRGEKGPHGGGRLLSSDGL